MLQSIMTSNPSRTYTGDPILTLLVPFVTLYGLDTNDPSSISGGSPNNKIMPMHRMYNYTVYKFIDKVL